VKLNIQDINSTRKSVTVSVTADEISGEEKELLRQFSGQAKIKGFRSGKAPAHLLKAQFGKQMAEELNRKVISKAYETVIKNSGLKIFGIVDIDKQDISKIEDIDIKFTTDIVPEFELPEYKNIEVESHCSDVSEEDTQKAIDSIREQRADYKVVEREAKKGDYAKISYEGKVGDQLIADLVPENPIYGKQAITWEEVGSEHTPGVQAIVQGLISMKVGDKKTVKQEFAKDFEVVALAGKTAVYEVEILEVREKVLPEVDEAFIKSLKLETIQDLHERINKELVRGKNQENNAHMRKQILENINSRINFDLPESAVEGETQSMLAMHMREGINKGVPMEEFEKHKDELVESARKAATDHVKTRFILSRIAEVEKIKVKNEDMQERILQEAMMTRTKPEVLVKELQKDSARLEDIQRSVLFNKTLDFLVQSAKLSSACGHNHSH
jgi:trigger factor